LTDCQEPGFASYLIAATVEKPPEMPERESSTSKGAAGNAAEAARAGEALVEREAISRQDRSKRTEILC
jgi:hypothetical protein